MADLPVGGRLGLTASTGKTQRQPAVLQGADLCWTWSMLGDQASCTRHRTKLWKE